MIFVDTEHYRHPMFPLGEHWLMIFVSISFFKTFIVGLLSWSTERFINSAVCSRTVSITGLLEIHCQIPCLCDRFYSSCLFPWLTWLLFSLTFCSLGFTITDPDEVEATEHKYVHNWCLLEHIYLIILADRQQQCSLLLGIVRNN